MTKTKVNRFLENSQFKKLNAQIFKPVAGKILKFTKGRPVNDCLQERLERSGCKQKRITRLLEEFAKVADKTYNANLSETFGGLAKKAKKWST